MTDTEIFVIDAHDLTTGSVVIVGLTIDLIKIILVVEKVFKHSYIILNNSSNVTDHSFICAQLYSKYNISVSPSQLKLTKRKLLDRETMVIYDNDFDCLRVRYLKQNQDTVYTPYSQNPTSLFRSVVGGNASNIEELFLRRGLGGWVTVRAKVVNKLTVVVENDKCITENKSKLAIPSEKRIATISLYCKDGRFYVYGSDTFERIFETEADCLTFLKRTNAVFVLVYRLRSLPISISSLKCVSFIDIYTFLIEFYPKLDDYSISTVSGETDGAKQARWIFHKTVEMDLISLLLKMKALTSLPISHLRNRTERVEWLLIKQMRSLPVKCVFNDVYQKHFQDHGTYVAGLVLDPKIGIYDNDRVSVLDFTSMYPSVCVELNICWSRNGLVIASLMKKLISQRKYVNDNPHEFECPKSEALALKLLANIIYGTLGFQQSRFYTLRLAEKIAQRGRDILSKTVEVVSLTHRDVSIIYGDTDSVMVCCDNSKDRARIIAEEINAAHVSAIHLKYENTYKRLILFGKKRYAAINSDNDSIEIKGLDCKKRGFSLASRTLCMSLTKLILEKKDVTFSDAKDVLDAAISNLRESVLRDTEQFVITKKLSRPAGAYKDTRGLYHVKAALVAIDNGQVYGSGDFVRYIMGVDGIVYPEVLFNVAVPDVEWYIAQMNSVADRIMTILPGYHITQLLPQIVHHPRLHTPCKSLLENPVTLKCICCNGLFDHFGMSKMRADAQKCSLEEHEHLSLLDLSPLTFYNRCPHCNVLLTNASITVHCMNNNSKIAYYLSCDIAYILSQYRCSICRNTSIEFLKKYSDIIREYKNITIHC